MGFHHFYDRVLSARSPQIEAVDLTMDQRLELVRAFGSGTLAYSTAVQAGLSYFGSSDGYIAFKIKSGFVFALGDPVAPPDRRDALIKRFLAVSKKPSFLQISSSTASTLVAQSYRINVLGIETDILLGDKMFAGGTFKSLRYSERWLTKMGFSIAEFGPNETGGAERVSSAWLKKQRVRREMAFLNRPLNLNNHEDMRRFMVRDNDGNPVSFIDLDPIYEDGNHIGFTTTHKRRMPDAPSHAEVGVTVAAARVLHEEGYKVLGLGLSPLVDDGSSTFSSRPIWRRACRACFNSKLVNRHIFNVQGHASFKSRMHGTERPSYMAIGSGSLFEAIAAIRLLKLV